MVLLVGYYQELSIETYLWYYAPVGLYLLVALLHVGADLLEGAAVEAPATRELRAALAPVAVILALPLIGGVAVTGRTMADPHLYSLQENDRAAAEWIAENLPEDAVLASWDAGVIGYFADRRVVNLDGVVNSFEWRDAMAQGTEATAEFLHDRGVGYIVNHGAPVNGEDPDLRRRADLLFGDGAGARLELVMRWDFTYSGRAGGEGGGDRPFAVFLYKVPIG
jgi:hypothetical protein